VSIAQSFQEAVLALPAANRGLEGALYEGDELLKKRRGRWESGGLREGELEKAEFFRFG
jgi:hypothetical protein